MLIPLVGMLWMGCGSPDPEETPEAVPEAVPVELAASPRMSPMPFPVDNPLSEEAIQLGRALFYDAALSVDGTVSCASCHQQAFAFGDNRARSVGARGLPTDVNTPPLINLAWAPALFWDGRASSIEEALSEHLRSPNIMAREPGALRVVLEGYDARLRAAFPEAPDPVSEVAAVNALASFVRSLVSFNAPLDRFSGDEVALTDIEQRGTDLMDSRLSVPDDENVCNRCHQRARGLAEDDGVAGGLFTNARPRNNGTGTRRVPTVRNIAVTAPYFHDGSAADLAAVIAHYHKEARNADAALVDDGGNPITPEFTEEELEALVAGMGLFTDTEFLSDPKFGKP